MDISKFPGGQRAPSSSLAGPEEPRATEQEWYELQQPQMAYEKFLSVVQRAVYQEINRTDAFAYDNGKPGMFVNNKVFFDPQRP